MNNNEIDMSKYNIRTDLVVESIDDIDEDIKLDEDVIDDVKITRVRIKKEFEEKLNKKKGRYITIEFDDITDMNNNIKVSNIFTDELKKLIESLNIKEKDSCLVIGLGNEKSTADSLGPNTIDNVIVTRYLFIEEDIVVDEDYSCVSAFNPSVTVITGIETSTLIKSVVNEIKPSFLIVVDALAAKSIERVNKTIQMTDSGIHPGSGVGNARKEISKSTIGIPVIAIGIPTIVDAVTIVSDTINFMMKHFSYIKETMNDPKQKLVIKKENYLKNKKIKELETVEKQKYIGFLGTLSDEEIRNLVYEVLSPINYNLMVTPKEVDFLIHKLSLVLSNGINNALHKNIKNLSTN